VSQQATNISGLPFDDIRNLLSQMPEPDQASIEGVRARSATLVKPQGSLGRLETIAEWFAGWQGSEKPKVQRPVVCIFAANHNVVEEGVSAWPSSITRTMVETFAAGGGAINQICAANDLGLKVFDLALDMPTPNIANEDALDEPNCAATMAFGMEAVAGGTDLLCLGEMGIGNTTIASAIYYALFGGKAEDWVGPGAGADEAQLKKKADVIRRAIERNKGHLDDPLEILRRVGGREVAAIAGAILAARLQRVPVLIDGFVVTAAAGVLYKMDPATLDHCLFAHKSAEPGHVKALQHLNAEPLFDFGMSLGEGTGAALAVTIIKSALAIHNDMATLEQVGIKV
jgi:nicotinate-nucleotide--dimethylbenzimidazole phosphoribosyltransferase